MSRLGLVFLGAAALLAARGRKRADALLPTMPGASLPVESYPPSEPPTGACSGAQPGTIAFRDFVLHHFGGRDLGIVRQCGLGQPSHHHEGRAWDWGVLANRPDDRARVERLRAFLSQNGDEGYRRAGVRYLIWNRQIEAPGEGPRIRPYHGTSPHTDHVHFGLSLAGAAGLTSFYQGADRIV